MNVRILTAAAAVAVSALLWASPAAAGTPGGDPPPAGDIPGIPTIPGVPTTPGLPGSPGLPGGPDVPDLPGSGNGPGAPADTVPVISLNLAGPGEPSTLLLSATGSYVVSAYGYQLGTDDEILLPATDGQATTQVTFPAGTTTLTVHAYQGDTLLGTTSTDITL